MAKDLPYLASYKNVGSLFERINKAKVPDAFTVRYLADTIGLKSTGDRQLISMLKKLGFLDGTGKPLPSYNLLKNSATAPSAIANGIRKAYAPLYEADENAQDLPGDQLRGLIAQVSGAEEGAVKLINGTFNSLVKNADFKAKTGESEDASAEEAVEQEETSTEDRQNVDRNIDARRKFSPEFRFNIEIHLPSNGTEETYLSIFNALRKALG